MMGPQEPSDEPVTQRTQTLREMDRLMRDDVISALAHLKAQQEHIVSAHKELHEDIERLSSLVGALSRSTQNVIGRVSSLEHDEALQAIRLSEDNLRRMIQSYIGLMALLRAIGFVAGIGKWTIGIVGAAL